jgi:hypothetical protein
MAQPAVSPQVLFEHQLFANVTSELRTAILSNHLADLPAVGLSFADHLRRMIALEEQGGYMVAVLQSHPEMARQVEALRREHRSFRNKIGRLTGRLRRVAPTDHESLVDLADHLLELSSEVDEHCTQEVSLLERTLL